MSIIKHRKTLLSVLILLSFHASFSALQRNEVNAQAVGVAQGQGSVGVGTARRVHAPFFPQTVEWAEAGIFWFGRVDPPDDPGQNYADVRVGYTEEKLVIYVNVQDYYVWYDEEATSSTDLTRYDAVAVYLDTSDDRASTPQPDDYYFLSGLCLYGCEDGSSYGREAQGTGTGWDTDWHEDWHDTTWASWYCNPGPNNNDCGIDFGWWSYISVPWEAVDLSGPPVRGTRWGLGIQLHDRDDHAPAGYVSPESWPETFSVDSPSSWGELTFGFASYTPPPAVEQGTIEIRRGLRDGVVEDAWVGGGGTCAGGHKGDPEHDTYGDDSNLFVANQSGIADFPCYSKTFLRFGLGDIPAGKTVMSATLTLHHWSNAKPEEAQPSLISLFAVDGHWEENSLTWNNAPLARANLSARWVDPLTSFPGWPGVRYDWDATQAVADVYTAGEPLNVALYTADTNMHSSKYLVSSDTGDWNAEARPTLTVVYGEPMGTLEKRVRPVAPSSGEVITYTMVALGSGRSLTLTDVIPDGVSDPGPIQVTGGTADYDAASRRVEWRGPPAVGHPVTITFPVRVEMGGPDVLVNTATLVDAVNGTDADTAVAIVDGFPLYLPVAVR